MENIKQLLYYNIRPNCNFINVKFKLSNSKMIKNVLFTILLFVLLFSGNAFAQKNGSKAGVGIIVGAPTGISIKFLNSGYRHFNGAVAWSSGKNSNLHLHADYIFKKWRISAGSTTNFNTFIGGGLQLETKSESFGVRIPLGVSYTFYEVPIDVFIEVVPGLGLVPDTDFNIDAAFAIRFLF